MKRPIGVILSAVVLSLAALFLLLMTVLMVFAGIHARSQPSISAAPHFITYLVLAMSLFYAVLAAWAILTVIGILRLRSWGRYSILIIGGGLSVLGLLAALFSLVGRTILAQQPPQPIDPHIMTVVFVVLTVFYLFLAAIGIWWLVYFNLRSIRELFANPNLLSQPQTNDSPFSRAPTAIKIIGIFLLLGSVCCLLCTLLPFPAFLFGFILPPSATHILYLGFAVISALAGYGLLRLKESARLLTIGFLIVGICNIGLLALPWYQARLSQYTTQITSYIPTMPGQPHVFTYNSAFYLYIAIVGIVVYAVILWLLHRYRAAFRTTDPTPMLEV
jgi:hypothetical protein